MRASISILRTKHGQKAKVSLMLVALAMAVLLSWLIGGSGLANAAPEGPTVLVLQNQTNVPDTATIINTTGGSVTTVTLNATTQDTRWKAYIGNVTGRLTLDDASGYTIYNWVANNPGGEIYATRKSSIVSWANIQCANLTMIENENNALNHTNIEDNITSTFSTTTHSRFYVGTTEIGNNTCYSVHTYVNNSAQSSLFEEVVLYDGTNATNGNIVFASLLENDRHGYNNQTYDFQLIVPENGLPTWSSSTAYYFYVELG